MITDISEKIDLLYSESNNEYKKNIKQIKIVELDKDIKKYNDLLDGILEDYKKDYILKEDFEKYNREYLYELNRLRLEREKLNKNENNDIDLKWINDLKNNGKIENIFVYFYLLMFPLQHKGSIRQAIFHFSLFTKERKE